MAFLRNYLRRDGPLLAAALLLAVVVWKYANDELTETQVVQARLELTVPPGIIVVSGVPPTVRATLGGTRRRLAGLDPAGVVARARLPEAEGLWPVRLSERDFTLPEGVFLADAPRPFELVLEKPFSRKFPVKVNTMGRPAPGAALLGALAEPAEVTVVGPKERFERLERQGVTQVETESVDLAGRRQSFVVPAKLNLPAEMFPQESVRVLVEIGAEPVSRTISGVEVKLLVPSGFDLRVRFEGAIALALRGDPRVLEALSANPGSILAMADVGSLGRVRPGAYEVDVKLQLPAGVSLAPGAEIPKVRVQLSEK